MQVTSSWEHSYAGGSGETGQFSADGEKEKEDY